MTVVGAECGIENPRFQSRMRRRLEIRQRRVSRKSIGSSNRRKSAKRLGRTHQKIRRQRQDHQWKAAKKIAENADITVFEDLNIKGMISRCQPKVDPVTGQYLKNGQAAKAGLNKAIADSAWYSLRQKTKHQAAKLGNIVIEVDPKYTSQECAECHHISSANRDKEKFVCEQCEQCGHADDADVNGAINQAHRGKQKLGTDSLRVVSPKVTLKEAAATPRASSVSREEPRNPAKSTAKHRQLRLLTLPSIPVQKPRASPKRRIQTERYTQMDLFSSFDRDARESKAETS